MPLPLVGYGSAVLLAAVATVLWPRGPAGFVPEACYRVEAQLREGLMGQDLAVGQTVDAICEHLRIPNPRKPLVLSMHGPPGVGKSLTHLLLARALYNVSDSAEGECPGPACPGYRILFGQDYLAEEQETQSSLLRQSIQAHLSAYPESLIVLEEYDKVDCRARGMLKQLIDKGSAMDKAIGRAVLVLESNTGYIDLHRLVAEEGRREAVSMEAAQRVLKEKVFSRWKQDACEDRADTLKTLSLMDLFVPFLPLERVHVEQVIQLELRRRGEQRRRAGQLQGLSWSPEVVAFLSGRVEYDGRFSIEGAKEVLPTITRYVSRALREWEAGLLEGGRGALVGGGLAAREAPGGGGEAAAVARRQEAGGRSVRLEVSEDGAGLVCQTVPPAT